MSEVVSDFKHNCWFRSWIEDVAGELHLLAGQAEEKASLSITFNSLCPLRDEADVQPVDRRVGELWPGVEVVGRWVACVEYIFIGDPEVELPVGHRRLGARCNPGCSAENATNHRCQNDIKCLSAEFKVIAKPQ
jgi:hypothetical protein